MIIKRSVVNTVAFGVTITPVHLVNKAGEQPGGVKMLEYMGLEVK